MSVSGLIHPCCCWNAADFLNWMWQHGQFMCFNLWAKRPKKGHQELFLLRSVPPLLFLPRHHTDGPMLPSIIQRVVMPADPRLHPWCYTHTHNHTRRQCQFPRLDPCLCSPDWIRLVQYGAATLGLRGLHGPAGSYIQVAETSMENSSWLHYELLGWRLLLDYTN